MSECPQCGLRLEIISGEIVAYYSERGNSDLEKKRISLAEAEERFRLDRPEQTKVDVPIENQDGEVNDEDWWEWNDAKEK